MNLFIILLATIQICLYFVLNLRSKHLKERIKVNPDWNPEEEEIESLINASTLRYLVNAIDLTLIINLWLLNK